MQGNQTLLIQHQMRGTAHGLQGVLLEAFEAKQKIPSQKAVRALHDPVGDHKAGRVQRLKHVPKDALDGGQALDVIEGVFEVSMGRVVTAHFWKIRHREVLKQGHQTGDRLFHGEVRYSSHGLHPREASHGRKVGAVGQQVQ